mmetsp:Transcript_42183/g.82755  ORF Transcript_42183/g.82755 Transcript_42183/m.82755 type:complete len:426 (+) Transcript_42183:39-1316(+)
MILINNTVFAGMIPTTINGRPRRRRARYNSKRLSPSIVAILGLSNISLFYLLSNVVDAFSSPRPLLLHRTRSITSPDGFSPKQNRTPSSDSASRGGTRLHSLDIAQLLYDTQAQSSSLASTAMVTSSASPATLALLYGAGLLTSFSPCAFSLLPLTVSYISSAAGEREDGDTLIPTLAFAGGLASVFCGAGLSVAFLGGVFGAGTEGGAVSSGILDPRTALAGLSSLVAVGMGLQLLELVDIPLPSFDTAFDKFTQRSDATTAAEANGGRNTECSGSSQCSTVVYDGGAATKEKFETGSTAGPILRTFLLGCSSALVASPCATPVLTSVLAFVASTQDMLVGTALLLAYTMGYTTPLLTVGFAGGGVLANAAAGSSDEGGGIGGGVSKFLGQWVSPMTAVVLISYGTNGFLKASFGDPSLMLMGI